MLESYDMNRRKTAVLENAFNIKERRRINTIWSFSFDLPKYDLKNQYCQIGCYVRFNGGELYIINDHTSTYGPEAVTSYECEHALATLIYTSMFGQHVVGNLGVYTNQVIQYVLDRQLVKNWVLGECDFNRQFEYGWEQESLAAALFSIPQPFVDKYIWKTDTKSYPWKVSLKRLDPEAKPKHYIHTRKNLISLEVSTKGQRIFTRIYPLGEGEGINQLNIKKINGGIPYIQSPTNIIDKFGIRELIWVDRRYTNPETLKAEAEVMLNALQEPYVEYSVKHVVLDGEEPPELGDVVHVVEDVSGEQFKNYIVEIVYNHGDSPTVDVSIANKPEDIARHIADYADRQRIEMTYSQGATQIYAASIADNGNSDNPVELDFYIDSSMKIVNFVKVKIKLTRFRAYSESASSTVQSVAAKFDGGQTSNGAVQSVAANSDGGQTSGPSSMTTTASENVAQWGTAYTIGPASGMESYQASSGTPHVHGIQHGHSFERVISHTHNINHTHTVPAHTHTITTKEHQHTIPSHTHEITTQAHVHTINPVIALFGGTNGFALLVDERVVAYINSTEYEADITNYLVQNGSISRGNWHIIGVRPNGLARARISYSVQGFIQSRGDKTV